jgi:AcrR family transcriptional regulator
MHDAFWQLLKERDYSTITVTDIVRRAGVNRNSFYYHFSGLPELADSSILQLVESTKISLPGPDADPNSTWRENVTHMLSSPAQRERLDRLALLAGPHSSSELLESLRDFTRLTVLSFLQLDANNLDLDTDLLLDFAVGGMLAILRRWPELCDTISIDDLLNQDVAVLAMGLYLSMSKSDMKSSWERIFHAQSPRTEA